ncbi:hypothetical protein FSP39_014896 [Pinctada imbricata]|uniref:VWFA domain-containing protein n=1 Tax=Pinctada imbricata TaxID=66713 RepID=A0AA88YTK3_PINIB|nr:hypothetical protein FSP39_014896 [Pinctada imbricata]
MRKCGFSTIDFLPWILIGSLCFRGIQGCGPVKADIVLLIDESGSVGRRNFPKQLDFCNTLIDSLNIGADDVRIGAVTFSDDPVFHFALDAHTTSTDVKTAISNIDYKRGGTDIAKGIDYVKDTFLTSANGDRSGVADYILLVTDGTSSGAATSGQAAIASGITIWVVGIGYEVEPYQQELIDIVTPQDDFYFFASDFDDLTNIAPQVAAVLPCPYFCGEWAISYASPVTLTQFLGTNTGEMYLLNDAVYDINCCAVISGWEFYANATGDVTMLVWRNRGAAYELMGSNTITVTASDVGKVKNYTVPVGQRIGVVAGDRLGWYSSGTDIIPYDYCNTTQNENCPQSTMSTTPGGGLPVLGSMFDWNALSGTADRGYAIQAYTTNSKWLFFLEIKG